MLLLLMSLITNPTVSIGTQPINEISLGAIQSKIEIPSDEYPSSTTATSLYSITTNEEGKKLIASLTSTLPDNLTISAEMTAPSKARSLGKVLLTNEGVTLVTGVSKVAQEGLSLTYTFNCTAPILAGIYTEIVRITITD